MKRILRIIVMTIGGIVLVIASSLGIWHFQTPTDVTEASKEETSSFKGSILAASDADMIATAYANGKVNKVDGIEDSLTLIVHDKSGTATIKSQEHISNSVISWPSIIAWNAEKEIAYVAETRDVYRKEENKMNDVFVDFPEGRKIIAIDYSDRENPNVLQEIVVGENIQGVSLNKDKSLLVSGSTESGKELIISTLEDGLIQQSFYFTHPKIKKKDTNNGGFRTIEFHPTENIIAVNLNNTHLVFFSVTINGNDVSIDQIGSSIEVAKRWSVGNWHTSGKYFILTDVAWGNGAAGAIFNGKGKLVSVKLDVNGNHEIVSEVEVGLSPEGFDLSPDGKYAIVANMRRTYGPKAFWFVPARKNSSLSLVKINPVTGELETLGKEYLFEGALPEDAIFDEESNSIAVAVYHKQDKDFPTQGWVDYWELDNDRLIKMNQRTYLTRGVHNLLLIPN